MEVNCNEMHLENLLTMSEKRESILYSRILQDNLCASVAPEITL